jgi:hypothetical protein
MVMDLEGFTLMQVKLIIPAQVVHEERKRIVRENSNYKYSH